LVKFDKISGLLYKLLIFME